MSGSRSILGGGGIIVDGSASAGSRVDPARANSFEAPFDRSAAAGPLAVTSRRGPTIPQPVRPRNRRIANRPSRGEDMNRVRAEKGPAQSGGKIGNSLNGCKG